MDEIRCIVFAIGIASLAVLVLRLFDFVLNHGLVSLEMLIAGIITAFDVVRHDLCSARGGVCAVAERGEL